MALLLSAPAASADQGAMPGVSAAPDSAVSDQVDLLLFDGELLLEEGKIAEAMANFNQVVALDPERLEGHLMLARAITGVLLSGNASGDASADEALNQYRWVLRRDPSNLESQEGEKLLLAQFFQAKGPQFKKPEAEKAWKEGQEALARGDAKAAARALDRAAREEPEAVGVHQALGEVLEKAGEPEKALKAYEEAAVRAPQDPLAHSAAGRVLETLGRPEDALQQYAQALSLSNHHEPAVTAILRLLGAQDAPALTLEQRSLLGRAHLAAGHLDEVIAVLEPVVATTTDFEVRKSLATAYFLKERDEEALALFQELQGTNPHDVEVLYYLGAANLRMGQAEEGRRHLRSVLAINPHDPSALRLLGMSLSEEPGQEREAINLLLRAEASGARMEALSCILGTLYLRTGFHDRAQAELTNCLNEKPDFLGAHLGLGVIADDRGDKGTAIEHLERYLELEKNPEPAAVFRLAVAYLRAGKDVKGFETLRRLIALHDAATDTAAGLDSTRALEPAPSDTNLLEMTTFFLATIRRFDDAIFIGEMLLTRDPENAVYNNNLAMSYADAEKNLPRALQLAEKATRLDADNPGHLDTLGWVLVRLGRLAEAERTLTRTVHLAEAERQDNMSEIYYHLGALYQKQGRADLARTTLQKALKNPPTVYLRDEIQRLLDALVPEAGTH